MPRASSPLAVEVHEEESAITNVQGEPQPPPALRPSRPSLKRRITRPTFMVELTAGSPIGEYEIQAQIGEGAMGTVFSAVHPLIGKTVAIKVLKPELCANQASIDRFVQEAQSVNRIGHPNIVDVFALGELPDGRAYFVMEWLRGEDLKVRLARGPMSVEDTCNILDGIARALEAAHDKDVVHRDLKPDNVFLHQVEHDPMHVKLLDFGIAKLMRAQAKIEKTQTGNMLGTPRYISPEQARGVDVDHRADIYSLGVMAYEMLAGRPPFEGETAMDLVVKHLSDTPPPLSQFVRVPKMLEQCVMRMLEKDPADRPSLAVVRQIINAPTSRLATLPQGVGARARKRNAVVIGGALIAAIAVGVVSWQLVRAAASGESVPAPAPAPVAITPITADRPAPPRTPVEPAIPAPTMGTLHVAVTGAKDAVISVDGKEWGRGSLAEVEIEPGLHVIEVRAAGRAPISQRVSIEAGQANTVAIVVPAAQPVKKRGRRKPPAVTRPAQPDEDGLLAPKRKR